MNTPFPQRLAAYAATVFAGALVLGGYLAVSRPLPPLGPLAVFCGLVVFSAQRQVRLPNGVFLSPGLMVCIAAIVAFDDRGGVLGPLVVGCASVLRFNHFRRNLWGWLPFNAGITGLALAIAAAVYALLPGDPVSRLPVSLLYVLPPAVAFVTVSWTLLVLSYVIEEGHAPKALLLDLGPSVLQVLPFAIMGLALGALYLELGTAVLLLVVVPIVIAREMFASSIKVRQSHDETVHMLVRALEAKDRYTAGHAERVANYAEYMGEAMAFGPARMERLRFAALMHDIGKLVVPNHILNKPGKLTESEYRRIRMHDQVSVEMLSHIDFLRPIAAQTHSDRMRFDPDDPNHPIEPYMVMIADAYDAMTSTRAYRRALPQDVAFRELRDKAGIQFHPECVELLIRALEQRNEKHGAGYEEEAEFDDAPESGLGSAGLGDLLPSEAAGT